MSTVASEPLAVETLEIRREVEIAAPVEAAFQAVLEQLGPDCQMPGEKPFPMTFEAWPGGRWFRDLSPGAGHLWGHVQVIKPPTLLEVCGPLMMSQPAINHVQYRLTAEVDGTRLAFVHRGVGLFMPEHRDGLAEGWGYWLTRVRDLAEGKARREATR